MDSSFCEKEESYISTFLIISWNSNYKRKSIWESRDSPMGLGIPFSLLCHSSILWRFHPFICKWWFHVAIPQGRYQKEKRKINSFLHVSQGKYITKKNITSKKNFSLMRNPFIMQMHPRARLATFLVYGKCNIFHPSMENRKETIWMDMREMEKWTVRI